MSRALQGLGLFALPVLAGCSLTLATFEYGSDGGGPDGGSPPEDAGTDGGVVDAGPMPIDAGADAGGDAGPGAPCSDLRIEELSLGRNHSCARHACGAVSCWGAGSDGQLGLGMGVSSGTPAYVPGITDATRIHAGDNFTCAIRAGGGVYCWGDNDAGMLGDGTGSHQPAPSRVRDLVDMSRFGAGSKRLACAFGTAAGSLHCWGANDRGQLGDGTMLPRDTPVLVSDLSAETFLSVAVSLRACAVTSSNALYCWGDNAFGGLGIGDVMHRASPMLVAGATGVAEVAVGAGHTCVRETGGDVRCWGWNRFGQLGVGTTDDILDAATAPRVVSPAASIVAGENHTCMLSTSGNVACWGDNAFGQLGLGTNDPADVPETTLLSGSILQIAAGYNHTCAIDSENDVYCFGANDAAQLGLGRVGDENRPMRVVFPR